MKIGIVTLWQSSDNYGQQLQCYALQRYLRELGHDAFLIKYDINNRNKNVSIFVKIKNTIKSFINLTPFRKFLPNYQLDIDRRYLQRKNEQRNFSEFRNEFIVQSKLFYKTLSELRKNPPQADVYIVGSDQVWAHLLNDEENKAFFLDFGDSKTKRISYAASFAMNEYPSALTNKLKDQLSLFDNISVREYSGVTICTNIGVKAIKVLDPTLLLVESDYNVLQNHTKEFNNKNIYIYSLNISSPEEIRWDELKEYAHVNSRKIIVTPASGYVIGKELFPKECVAYDYATIPQWLKNIGEASLVITTSFHGVVFCILKHTQFVYIPLSGKKGRGNNRIFDLLSALNLSHRTLDKEKCYKDIADSPIDWSSVDLLLQNMRKESFSFLNTSLNS